MAEFGRSTHEARSFAELKRAVEKGSSEAGLMLFMQLDHGAVLRKETSHDTLGIIRFVIGDPLMMKEMAKHVPDAGSYAPVTILVDERPDGVHLSYDRIASTSTLLLSGSDPGKANNKDESNGRATMKTHADLGEVRTPNGSKVLLTADVLPVKAG